MIQCGEIYYVRAKNCRSEGCEMRPDRPGIVISSPEAIATQGTVNVVYLTSSTAAKPFTVRVSEASLTHAIKKYDTQQAICGQIFSVDKGRLGNYLGKISKNELDLIQETVRRTNF